MDRGGVGSYSELSCRQLCKQHYLIPPLFIEEGNPQGGGVIHFPVLPRLRTHPHLSFRVCNAEVMSISIAMLGTSSSCLEHRDTKTRSFILQDNKIKKTTSVSPRLCVLSPYSIACWRSAMMSSTFSIPTERRMRSGATPASRSCSSVS